MDCRNQRGTTVVELMVSMVIFGGLSLILFALFSRGTKAVIASNAQHQAQLSLNKVHTWLKKDIEQADPRELDRKRVTIPGSGDAVWFLSADDPYNTDPNTRYIRSPETGKPIFQTVILYYLVRPADYDRVSSGYPAMVDPDPVADFYAPHKFLVRKVIDLEPDPAIPEKLPTPSEIEAYITQPQDHGLQPFPSEAGVTEFRLIADQMLSFEVIVHPSVIEVSTAALRIEEARKKSNIGNQSFKTSPLTEHRKARFQLRR